MAEHDEVEVPIKRGGAELAQSRFEPICQLYDTVFSVPPFAWAPAESTRHREHLATLLSEPSFTTVIAERDSNLVGFAYGITLPATSRWWQGLEPPLPEETAREWMASSFAVIDFAVDQKYRRRGIGRALLDALLSERPEERATLSVQSVAEETQRFYAHLGWQRIGRKAAAPGTVFSSFDIYTFGLAGTRP